MNDSAFPVEALAAHSVTADSRLADAAVVRERFEACGIACTAQRLLVGQVLFARDQHVSAEQLLSMVLATGARVSKATVYNTLNLFADHGLARSLALGGEFTVFDSNTAPHHHLYNEQTGQLQDIAPAEVGFARLPSLPADTELAGLDVVFRVRRRTP